MAAIRRHRDKWQARVRRKGYPTKSRSFTNKADAHRWALRIEVQIETGDLPNNTTTVPTFVSALQRYEEEVSRYKKGFDAEKYRLAKLQKVSWSGLTLNKITATQVSDFKLKRLNEVAPPTVRKELYLISSVFETARKEWGLTALRNPVSDIKVPSGANPRRSRIPIETLTKLHKAIDESCHRYLPHIITLALETGMRRGEILNLGWKQYFQEKRLIELLNTKNGGSRYVPLSMKAIGAIDHGEKQNELIFPISGNAVRLAWERLKNTHGLEGVRFHDLRHEAISRMFDEGLTVPEVASISGHRTVSMLFRYAHVRSNRF